MGRISHHKLDELRGKALACGGELFRRPCPTCSSGVIRSSGSAICLTCGFKKKTSEFGRIHGRFTPEQAEFGARAEFRGLVLLARPGRWQKLIERARKKGNTKRARKLQLLSREALLASSGFTAQRGSGLRLPPAQ